MPSIQPIGLLFQILFLNITLYFCLNHILNRFLCSLFNWWRFFTMVMMMFFGFLNELGFYLLVRKLAVSCVILDDLSIRLKKEFMLFIFIFFFFLAFNFKSRLFLLLKSKWFQALHVEFWFFKLQFGTKMLTFFITLVKVFFLKIWPFNLTFHLFFIF